MVDFFEIKTYKRLEFALGAANVVFLASYLLVGYFAVLAPSHRALTDSILNRISATTVVALLPVATIAILWAWFATQILRLHDRIHEPLLRKWRAGYDSDFILRALLHDYNYKVQPEFFERAYANRRLRGKFLQRLFYNFVGDETKTAEGRRLFFYGEMAKYWSLGLLDIYTCFALVSYAGYAWAAGVPLAPWLVIAFTLVNVIARAYSNTVLDAAHDITIEQVAAIKTAHAAKLEEELDRVLAEQGMGGRR